LEINSKDYYLDLLFYNTKLRCYIVIELKNTDFKPEYAGKLNFYLSAVDDMLIDHLVISVSKFFAVGENSKHLTLENC